MITFEIFNKRCLMENKKEIRWKQRFVNFEKAFKQLKNAIDRFEDLDDLAKEGLVQRFEYTFELAKNVIKHFIESKGEQEKYPRDIIKKAFQLQIIENGELWIEMLEKRNLMANTYNENTFIDVITIINNSYFLEIEKLYKFFKKENEQ
jgi:nucleotidyltransferase substrate binding protein (TIGR01987 family)